jgi:hypothetical protein
MREASEWLERYRVMWEAKLDRLADYLERTAAEETSALTSPPDEGQAP